MNYPLLKSFKSLIDLTKDKPDPNLVKEIQSILVQAGFNLTVDGVVGAKTLITFGNFKQKAYLAEENILGETTAQALLEVVGDGKHPEIIDKAPDKLSGITFKLPSGARVDIASSIQSANNFTWGEATANGSRCPPTISIERNIIECALYLERIRSFFGNRTLTINSWYRPPAVNRSVGGVSNSTHLLGHGVDFRVQGIEPMEVYRRLDVWHGANGGLGKSSVFTHLDLRGYSARWRYGR